MKPLTAERKRNEMKNDKPETGDLKPINRAPPLRGLASPVSGLSFFIFSFSSFLGS
jgi:hypothetical protein